MALARKGLKDAAPDRPEAVRYAMLDAMTQEQLLSLRAQIDAMIDLGTIDQVNLGNELVLQLRTVKMLQEQASTAESYAHRAQTASVVQRLLQELTKMRTDVYNAERFKQVEGFVIKAWQGIEAPGEAQKYLNEAKDVFMEQYERLLATINEDNPLAEGNGNG